MRYLRSAVAAAIAAAALLVPSSAAAQIRSLSISSTGVLSSPEGDSATVTLAFRCRPAWNVAFGNATLAQSTGGKLARGFGDFINDFPGVPCTGARQTQDVVVTTETSFAFKPGKATATADLTVFNPTTERLRSDSTGPTAVKLSKH
jgi:hypothetical protein